VTRITMSEQVVIGRRFNGPPSSGHGGYSAWIAAQFIDGAAEVSLRRPPPLETPLDVHRGDDGSVELTQEGRFCRRALSPSSSTCRSP
jgi:hypothetical protein